MANRSRILILCVAFSSLFAFGCGSDGGEADDDNGGPPPEAMVGSWTYASVTVNGSAASLSVELDWEPETVAAELDVQSNGAYVYQEVDANGAQLWFELGFVVVDGNEIDVTIDRDTAGPVGETARATFTLTNDTLTLQVDDEGNDDVFTLVKQES